MNTRAVSSASDPPLQGPVVTSGGTIDGVPQSDTNSCTLVQSSASSSKWTEQCWITDSFGSATGSPTDTSPLL